MQETRGIFTRIPGNLLEDSGECYCFNIPGNVRRDSGECSRRFRGMFERIPGMFKKIPGNTQEDYGESKFIFYQILQLECRKRKEYFLRY